MNPSERIARLRRRYHEDAPKISVERARYYTQSWRETEGQGLSGGVRVALAMKHVYEKMTHHVDRDDRIAGYWTEDFLGIPVDVERGVYNKVLESELDKGSMIRFRLSTLKDTFGYMVRKRQLGTFIKTMRANRAAGPSPMDIGFKTMTEREINRFAIAPEDRRELKREILPYWAGRTVVDRLEEAVADTDLLTRGMKDLSKAVPANTSRQTLMISTCATIGTYQAHVILDHEKVIGEGLLAMRQEVRRALGNGKPAQLPAAEGDVLRSMEIALDGVIIFAERLADAIEEALAAETDATGKAAMKQMLDDCRTVPLRPAETFRQAVQSAWTVKTAVELAHPMNLHCFGRLDQIFGPYYERDLEAGRITRDEACELLEELLLKIMSQNIRLESNILSRFYHRYLGSSPVTIGGVRPDGTDGTNALTHIFIEAAERSKAVTNVSLRVHKETPEPLWLKVAETLHAGSSNLSLFNDDVNVEAMERRGFEKEDARDYAIMGCVEMLCPGKTGGMSASALLLNRLLDMTLRNGDSRTLMGEVHGVGLETGDPDRFADFDALKEAFLTQARHQVESLVEASNLKDRLFAEHLPAPHISAFIEGCLESRKDVTAGGALYDLSGISYINSIANAVDSLYVIKKLVFEGKTLTIKELLEAIDGNYVDHPEILARIRKVRGKWGNGAPEADALVNEVTARLFGDTYEYRSFKGGPFVPYVISMTTHTIDGRISIASPDGRKAATPYAASCNPYNVERQGVTAVMRSVAAIDYRDVLGCAVNIKFHPTAIGRTEEARKKWIALLRTYFQLGGAQLQPTVATAETLREAQKDPDRYPDLIVKVGGYSAYFTELGREIQDEVIQRTEHEVVG